MATSNPAVTFSSKAKILISLSQIISSAKILPVFSFSVIDFKLRSEEIIDGIQQKFVDDFLIIRSSAKNEDCKNTSNAGHFKTVANVARVKRGDLIDAINNVISSYDDDSAENEVLVQPVLKDIRLAGVAFTADISTLAPYYIINFDESGSADSVTSGLGTNFKTYVHFKYSPKHSPYKDFYKLINALEELEKLFGFAHLDVEFAFDNKDDLFIFQVRPITTHGKEDFSTINLTDALLKIHKKITKLSSPHPNLLGSKAIYGVMPDWNPAEIIGFRPTTLAASLYKEIITDSIWAYQRDNYGYRNLRSHPLMLLYLGIPYIDVRVDFNSFIPKDLDDSIGEKLVEFYLNKLIHAPVLHDKVEFEIVHSCFYFNMPEKLEEQLKDNFSQDEIKNIEGSLLALTNTMIDPEKGLYRKDLKNIAALSLKYDRILRSGLSLVDKIYWLIEDCKRFGTLPFAGIARSAFVATQFLKSFVELKIMSEIEYNLFVNSLNTITKSLNQDLLKHSKGEISKEFFLNTYGHLRPGTYDILSPRYDSNFENYFENFNKEPAPSNEFSFSPAQLAMIGELITKYKLKTTVDGLIRFIRESIEGREYSKFIFTRSLSQSLSLIEELALKYNVNREDLVFLDIKTVLNLYASLDHRDVKDIFDMEIARNKVSYNYSKAVKLPALITSPDDVYFHFIFTEEPNFITMKSVTAPIVFESQFDLKLLEQKIVFIKSADPGYDFLFTKKIGGLVTQFGGANSHMAVRCAELGIPAVIGAGEKNFNQWLSAKILQIDCANKQVKVLL